MRYWSPRELRGELERRVGPTELVADGFLTLNPQPTDLAHCRAATARSSGRPRRCERSPIASKPLVYAADSLYARSTRG